MCCFCNDLLLWMIWVKAGGNLCGMSAYAAPVLLALE